MTTPGKPPATNAAWARDVEAKIRQTQTPGNVTIGTWTLHERDGHLHATKAGQTVQLTFPPDASTPPNTLPDRIQRRISFTNFGTVGFGATNTFSLIYRGSTTPAIVVGAAGPASGDITNALVGLFPQYTPLDFTTQQINSTDWAVTVPGGELYPGAATSTGATLPVFAITPFP